MNTAIMALTPGNDLQLLLEELQMRGHSSNCVSILSRYTLHERNHSEASSAQSLKDLDHNFGLLHSKNAFVARLISHAALIDVPGFGTCIASGYAAMIGVETEPADLEDLLDALDVAPQFVERYTNGLLSGLVLVAQTAELDDDVEDIVRVFTAFCCADVQRMPDCALALC